MNNNENKNENKKVKKTVSRAKNKNVKQSSTMKRSIKTIFSGEHFGHKPVDSFRILAKGIQRSNDTLKTGLNNNDLIIGASNSGKTSSYAEPNLAAAQHSMVVADSKGQLYKRYHKYLTDIGFEVHHLDFVHPEQSECYNPLDYIKRKTEEYIDENGEVQTRETYRQADVKKIASVLIREEMFKDDKFWTDSARQVMVSLIAYVLEVLPKEEQHMGSVTKLYQELSTYAAERKLNVPFFTELEFINPDSFAVSTFHMYRGGFKGERAWSSISQFVSNALDVFTYSEYAPLFLGESSFNIADLGKKNVILFINVSDSDRSMNSWINLLYSQMINVLMEEADSNPLECLDVPVRIILDDFASNVVIADFDKIISVIRSREIYVSIIIQDSTQLETMYSRSQASTILNNCDTWLYLGGGDEATINMVAKRMNRLQENVTSISKRQLILITRGEEPRIVEKNYIFEMDDNDLVC